MPSRLNGAEIEALDDPDTRLKQYPVDFRFVLLEAGYGKIVYADRHDALLREKGGGIGREIDIILREVVKLPQCGVPGLEEDSLSL